jgi:hypothetical protein
VSYQTTYNTDPATDFSQLGPSTTPSSTAADLVDNLLGASGTPSKSGYSFTYTPGTAASGIISTYTIVAAPLTQNVTGQRQFFTDQSGVIRQTTDGTTPTAASQPIGG